MLKDEETNSHIISTLLFNSERQFLFGQAAVETTRKHIKSLAGHVFNFSGSLSTLLARNVWLRKLFNHQYHKFVTGNPGLYGTSNTRLLIWHGIITPKQTSHMKKYCLFIALICKIIVYLSPDFVSQYWRKNVLLWSFLRTWISMRQ